MKPQRQKFRHRPEVGEYGDCHRTAIACLLDLDREQVPHFYAEMARAESEGLTYIWDDEIEKYLNRLGLTQFHACYTGELDDVLTGLKYTNPGKFYLFGGASPRGVNHTVIGCGGKLVWDPHPDDLFVDKPLDNGVFQVTVFLPMTMKERAG